MGVNGEALQLHTVYKKQYFVTQVTQESVSVLQVMRESISGTTSHARIRIRYYKSRENPYQVLQVTYTASERTMKSEVCTIITIVPSFTRKNITYISITVAAYS